MFSFSEFFLIIFVAIVVLGPNLLQDLLGQIARFLRKKNAIISQLQSQWLALQKEQILAENNKRAQSADEFYKQK
jgi:Sec-independent protein translocase protein TatA